MPSSGNDPNHAPLASPPHRRPFRMISLCYFVLCQRDKVTLTSPTTKIIHSNFHTQLNKQQQQQ